MISGHNLRDPHSLAPSGGPRGPGSLIAKRVQTQFSLIAVTGAVLLFSDDPRNSRNDHLIEIVGNKAILTVHQDPPSGVGYAKRLKGGALAASIKTLRTSVPCGSPEAKWDFKPNATLAGRSGAFESRSRPGWCISTSSGNGPNKCGAAMAALMPCGPSVLGAFCGPIDQWELAPNGTIGSVFAGPNASLTRDANSIEAALWIQPNFAATDPDAKLQRWEFDGEAGTLKSTADGLCLGADPVGAADVNVWSRRLSNGSVALVFVNAEPKDAPLLVRCDWAGCLNATGLAAGATLAVHDLVAKGAPKIVAASAGVSAHVEGRGGSVTLLLVPED